jgi:hypothetical protein
METGPAFQPPVQGPDMGPAPVEVQPPTPERGGMLSRVAGKVGEWATSAYESVVTTVGMAQSGITAEKAGTALRWGAAALATGSFALKLYGARHGVETGGTGGMASHQVMDQVNQDHANFKLAEFSTPLADPSPSESADPLFDKDGNGTHHQAMEALLWGGIAVGTVAAIGSTLAVTTRARHARERAHLEEEYHEAATMVRLRDIHANAALVDRQRTRRTGVPRVQDYDGAGAPVAPGFGSRRERLPYADGTPVPNQDGLREYRPIVDTRGRELPPRRRGFWRSVFGHPTPKP